MFLPGQFIKKQPVSEDPSKRPRLVAYKTTVDADLKLSQLSKEVCPENNRLIPESRTSVSPKWYMLQSTVPFPRSTNPKKSPEPRKSHTTHPNRDEPYKNDGSVSSHEEFEARYIHALKQRFIFGTATGESNNCLIDSLYQVAVTAGLSTYMDQCATGEFFREIRQDLVTGYNAPEEAFLQHGIHGIPIVNILWNHMNMGKDRPPVGITAHSRQDIVYLLNQCSYADEELLDLPGELVFEEDFAIILHLFNYNNTHYIPLIPK